MKDKYEEALDKARRGLPMDKVFPELQESEEPKLSFALSRIRPFFRPLYYMTKKEKEVQLEILLNKL